METERIELERTPEEKAGDKVKFRDGMLFLGLAFAIGFIVGQKMKKQA